jgi:parallel beta-helix repeat protein
MRGRAEVVPTVLILIMFSFCLPCVGGSSGYVDVSVSEAKNMIDSNPLRVILDVRTQSEYDSGHIRNAKLIPHAELEARISELDEDRDTLVYCRSGHRSTIASEILIDHGFTQVYGMLGGILAWTDASYPVYVRYASIQQAINNASEGDSIFVSSGTYYERVVVNKTVSLVGEDPETTVIDGNETQTIFEIPTHNVNITGFTVQNGDKGVYLSSSSGSSIVADSNVVNNSYGFFVKSDNNLLTTNNIVNSNVSGIELYASCGCSPVHGNTVTKNMLLNNSCGIRLRNSLGGLVCHNSFVNNTQQVFTSSSQTTWDKGYPSGGNYWSDYTKNDTYRGPYQNETGSDGIGDTPYVIDGYNRDNCPLMGMFSDLDVVWEEKSYRVNVISNSTVSDFGFGVIYEPEIRKEISFNVTGEHNTVGFCRVMIPTELMNYSYTVLVNGEEVDATLLDISNSTHTYLYFTYKLSTKHVVIIPEFPSALTLPLFTIATLIAVVLMKYKYPERKTRQHSYAGVRFFDRSR